MERSYKILPKAKMDLENLFRYISEELYNTESALVMINKFEMKFNDICLFPKAHPIITLKRVDHNGLRKAIVDNFIVVYLYDEEKELINIVRVIYSKRDYLKEI
jgi:plasmid stabilization system protein ParE